jgi:hypothetical protein
MKAHYLGRIRRKAEAEVWKALAEYNAAEAETGRQKMMKEFENCINFEWSIGE